MANRSTHQREKANQFSGSDSTKASKQARRRKRTRRTESPAYGTLEPRAMLNASPTAMPDYGFHTSLNTTLTISSSTDGVLGNDFDADSTITAVKVSDPVHGSLTFNSDGTFAYTPDTGYLGIDSFRYKVSDGSNFSRTKPVQIRVGDGFSANQIDGERTNSGFLHSGTLALEQSIGSGLSLSYRSDTIPVALVPVETFLTPGTAIPNSITANLTIDGVSSGDVTYTNSSLATGETLRFVLRALTPTSSTGMHDWTMSLKLHYTGSTVTQNFTGESALVNRVTSEFGTGWWLNGLDRIYDQSNGALLVNGDGSTLWFDKPGSSYHRAEGDLAYSTLVDTGTTFELTDKWGNERVFDSDGFLTRTKSVNNINDSFTFSYDASDRIEKITDEFNREFTFNYSGTTGKLTSVNDFAGRDSTISIVGGLLTSVTLADEIHSGYTAPEWTYGYTTIGGKSYLDSVTDPDSETTDYLYNTGSRKIRQIDHVADSSSWKLYPALTQGYDFGTGNTVHKVDDNNARYINERGHTFKFTTDRFGNLTSLEQPEGGTAEFDYDDASLLFQVTGADPDGTGTTYESPVTKFGYSLLGDLLTTVNADGTDTHAAYDSTLHVITQFTNELNLVENFAYDSVGNLTSYTDAESNQWTYTYNTRGRLLTEVTPDPDGIGPLTSITTTNEYDATYKDRLKKITWADSTFRSFTYTDSDRIESVTDELGRVTDYQYDPLDRLTLLSLPDPAGGTVTNDYAYEYDANLQLKKVTDPLGNTTEYKYNDRHWLSELVLPDPDGATTTLSSPTYEYTYDLVGNLISEVHPAFGLGVTIDYTYDKNNRVTDVSGPVTGQDHEYVYDHLNRLTQSTDPSGRTVKYEYDVRDRLTKVVDHGTEAPTTEFLYDGAGRLDSVIDALGRTTQYAYLDNNWLESTTRPDPDRAGDVIAPVYTNEYDHLGRLTKSIDPAGRFESFEYDSRHRLVSMTGKDPDSTAATHSALETEYVYDAVGRLISMSEASGEVFERTTEYGYDDMDRLTSLTLPDPDGPGGSSSPVYRYEYDLVGNLEKSIDPLLRETTVLYDGLYRRTEVTLPDVDGAGPKESVWEFTYNDDFQLESITDPVNLTSTRAYDSAGRLESFTNHAGNETEFTYDTMDRLKTITSPDPDGAGVLDSSVTTYSYDIYSRLSSIVDAELGTTTQTYDIAGQMLSLSDPEGNTTRWAYDGLGRMTMETDERGHTRSYNHNSVNRLVRTADRNGNIVRYENDGYTSREKWYSSIGAPTATIETTTEGSTGTNEVQTVTLESFATNDFFRLSFKGEVAAPLAHNATAVQVETALEDLESVDNVVVTESGGVFSVEFQGDLAGTNVEALMADAIADDEGTSLRTLTSEYDAFYRLIGTVDSAGSPSYDFEYDALDRVISQTEDPDWMLSDIELGFGYNSVGRRTSMDAAIGANLDYENTYSYDKQDRLTTVQQRGQTGGNDVADKRVVYAYDDLGRVTYVNRFEGTTSTNPAIRTVFSYDTDGYLSTLQHRQVESAGTSSVVAKYTYSYDNMDRITSINSTLDGVSSYSHDALSRLTDADHAVSRPDESFTYDDSGNRTGGGYTVGDDNLTESDGTYDYEYDQEGNRVKRTDISTGTYDEYTWDHRNRLTQVVTRNSSDLEMESVKYEYDVFNRMTQREHDSNGAMSPGGEETTYFGGFDGMNPTLEFDGTTVDDVSHRYLWLGDQLLADEQVTTTSTAGDVLWALADHIGTIRDIAEFDSGTSKFAITNHRVYDSFGNLTSETDSSVDLDFGFTGRWTDEATGMTHHLFRWYDPAIGKWLSDDPIGFSGGFANLQSYVGNQVLRLTDLNGLSPYGGLDGDANQGGDTLNLLDASIASNRFHMTFGGGPTFAGYRTGKFFARTWTNVSHFWGAYWESAWDGRQADAFQGFVTQADVEFVNGVISVKNQVGVMLERGGWINNYITEDFLVNEATPYYGNYEAFNGGQGSAWWTTRAQTVVAFAYGLGAAASSGTTLTLASGGGSVTLAGASGGTTSVAVSGSGALSGAGVGVGTVVAGGGIANWFVDPLQMSIDPKNGTGGSDPKGTHAAFEAAQDAWKNLPKDVRSMMHGINNGTRPLSDFTKLPALQRKAILDYYRTTGANASKANAEAVRQLNQHRLDYLNGLRPDPPGGIGNFPKPGGGS